MELTCQKPSAGPAKLGLSQFMSELPIGRGRHRRMSRRRRPRAALSIFAVGIVGGVHFLQFAQPAVEIAGVDRAEIGVDRLRE
jgi:hypothetical protein